MLTTRAKECFLAVVLAGIAAYSIQAAAPSAPQGKITARIYKNIAGTAVSDLTTNPNFPNAPGEVRFEPYFELFAGGDIGTASASDVQNNYGASMEGYFYPSTTGDYIFYISADDNAALYLSTDDNPANKKLIAAESAWSNPREFTVSGGSSDLTAKRSDEYVNSEWPTKNKITLEAGKAYYIQALQKEGGGGDNLSVSIDGASPIPGNRLAPFSWVTPLTLVKISAQSANIIQLVYSAPVDASAEKASNYSFNNGLTISSVTRVSGTTINLVTGAQTAGTTYTLTINGVQDLAPTPNVIAANTTVQFKPAAYVAGSVIHKVWEGVTDNTISGVTNNANFPNNPSYSVLLPIFEYPTDASGEGGSSYGDQLIGWFSPPTTGDYVFFVCSDDYGQLFLSTDDNPANKKLIAYENGWSGQRAWNSVGAGDVASKRSDGYAETEWPTAGTITLTTGKRYYIEAIHSEGGGGDSIAVTYKLANEDDPADGTAPKLTGSVIGTYVDPNNASLSITQQPKDASILQARSATLSVAVSASSAYGPNVLYHWQKAAAGSSTFENVTNGTGATYITPALAVTDSGSQYRVVVSNLVLSATSSVATVTVQADTFAPKITKVKASSVQNLIVTYDEPLDKTSAETAGNYTLSGGVTVSKATLSGNAVLLTTSGLTVGASYTLTVGGVKDLYNNTVAAGTSVPFKANVITYADVIMQDGPIGFYRFEETTGQKTKNYGSAGAEADGLYMVGNGPDDSAPSDAVVAPGPRPGDFLGFDPNNLAVEMDGANTMLWVDTQKQFLNNLPAFSLEYWVKPANRVSDPTSFGTRIGLVGQNDAVEYGFINQTTIQIWSSGGGSLDTTYSFPDNTWHHIATIADGKNIKNYFDGVLVGTGGSTTANYGSSTFNVHIGGGGVYDATGNFFSGQFDEVAIFDKAIPADRIIAHYKAGKEGGEAPGGEPGTFGKVTVSGGQVTIQWTGEGTLEEASSVSGPWSTAASQANPQTVPANGTKFYRLSQ